MSIQGSGEHPTFPAQWLDGLSRAHPGVAGCLVSVAFRKLAREPGRAFRASARLTPASRRRAHTFLPYASMPSVARRSIAHGVDPACNRLRARHCCVHRSPTDVRDDHDTPLLEGRDGEGYSPAGARQSRIIFGFSEKISPWHCR